MIVQHVSDVSSLRVDSPLGLKESLTDEAGAVQMVNAALSLLSRRKHAHGGGHVENGLHDMVGQ